jgi:Transglutaminase-like superfamily
MKRRTATSLLVSNGIAGFALSVPNIVFGQKSETTVLPTLNLVSLSRQLRFSLTLSNPRAKTLYDQIMWMYMPVMRSSAQDSSAVETNATHVISSDELGHSIIKIIVPELAPLAQRIFSITARVLLHSVPRPIDLVDTQSWLQAEPHTEVSDTRIQAQATQLKGPTPSQTARNIYDWVAGNIAYAGFIADDLGAIYALTERKGDCTEYAFLVVALARANQIPARMVGGYVTDRDTTPRGDEYHNWAELYFDGAWRIVDAQKKNWLLPSDQYIAFRYYRGTVINQVGLAHRYKVDGDMQVRI